MQKKLGLVSSIIPIESGETKEAELFKKAVNYYVEGDTQSCLDVLNYVLYLQPDNDKLKKLYRAIGEDANMVVTAPSEYGTDVVKEKLLAALGLFYENKFSEVIKKCNEVLRMEPSNTTALERLGSAYLKLNQKVDAKKVWEKAYMLNPDNKLLKKFIDKLDKEIQGAEDAAPKK